MPAAPRHILIFNMEAGNADALIVQYHTDSVEHGTKTGLSIGDHRDTDGAAYALELHHHLGEGAQAKIWITKRAGGHPAGVIDDRKPGFFYETSRDDIISARSHQQTLVSEKRAQRLCLSHEDKYSFVSLTTGR